MFFKNKSEKKTPKILEEIIKKTREDVKKREAEFSTDWLGRSLAFNNYMPRDVKKVLNRQKKILIELLQRLKKQVQVKELFERILTLCKLLKIMKKVELMQFQF